MPRVAYSREVMAQAVSLAVVIGAAAASERLGMHPRTIIGWMARAGKQPRDAITSSDWATLGELARTQVIADLAAGRVRTKDAAVIGAIATRNEAKPDAPVTPPTPVEGWADQVEAMLDTTYGRDADLALVLVIEWLETLPDAEAPDPAACMAYLAGLGDLHAHRTANDADRHEARAVQMAVNRTAASAAAQQVLDAETRDLVAAAEAWLAEHEATP
jgi:hypothetical protein